MTLDASRSARNLVTEHRDGIHFHRFAEIETLSDAYDVQDAFIAESIGENRCAGYKIGLTSRRMQEMCKIDQPIRGMIFSGLVRQSGARLSHADYGRLGVEFEICVRLGQDLVHHGQPFTAESVAAAVDGVTAAIEVVDDRHADYTALDCNTLIADNAWNYGVVLGPFVAPPAALDGVEGIAYLDGAEFSRGTGADVLGHPYVPLAWLANHLAAAGKALRKGDIVMTGSIVKTTFPDGPFRYRFDLVGLASVEVSGE